MLRNGWLVLTALLAAGCDVMGDMGPLNLGPTEPGTKQTRISAVVANTEGGSTIKELIVSIDSGMSWAFPFDPATSEAQPFILGQSLEGEHEIAFRISAQAGARNHYCIQGAEVALLACRGADCSTVLRKVELEERAEWLETGEAITYRFVL